MEKTIFHKCTLRVSVWPPDPLRDENAEGNFLFYDKWYRKTVFSKKHWNIKSFWLTKKLPQYDKRRLENGYWKGIEFDIYTSPKNSIDEVYKQMEKTGFKNIIMEGIEL